MLCLAAAHLADTSIINEGPTGSALLEQTVLPLLVQCAIHKTTGLMTGHRCDVGCAESL